ncbi:MAG: FAD-dependent oxidoreductase [Planctomycetes bacterium]|nr:FAD-dependent oxidoreductase [Planctomycetota bacterium]
MEYRIDETLDTEVLVIGSGTAGVCAAIQAARDGCKTVLIEKDDVLGGNSGPNLGVHVSGADCFHPYASETGVIGELEEEMAWRAAKMYTHGFHYNTCRMWETILQEKMEEAGVTVLKRHLGKRAVVDGQRIVGAIVEDLARFKTKQINISHFLIEASGDGHVAADAGASFMMGRDAKSKFNERSAPEEADSLTMGTSMTCIAVKTPRPVPFIPPPGCPDIPGKLWHPDDDLNFMWPTEHGGQKELPSIEADDKIYEGLLKQIYGFWNHVKNVSCVEGAKNWELIWVSPKAGKRESRRFIGDLVLTQTDVETPTEFEDSVAYGGYAVDVHEPQPDGRSKVVFYSIPPLYNIPYRSLYSRDIDNLFLAGRLISVTRLALGTTRLMKTGGAIGQAVGLAAGMCKRLGCTPRQLYEKHASDLQQELLKRDGTVLYLQNADPNDLARTATVTATSEEHFECTRATDALPLDAPMRGIMLLDWPEKLNKVSLHLRNDSGAAQTVELVVSRDDREETYGPKDEPAKHIRTRARLTTLRNSYVTGQFSAIAKAQAEVAAGFEGWVEFAFDSAPLPERDRNAVEPKLLLSVGAAEGVSWGRDDSPNEILFRCESADGDKITLHPEGHLFKIAPRPPFGEAANVINGYNRRIGAAPVNLWISRRDEAMPQSITLDLCEPKDVARVQITFDAMHEDYTQMPANCDRRVSEMLVRDYDVEVHEGGAWRGIISVRDNYSRFRVHECAPARTGKVRVVVKRVWDEEQWAARIHEVRIYGKE